MFGFLDFSLFDLLDILLVALLFFKVYMMVRGTQAINILFGLFLVYMIWLLVKSLDMQLLSLILGQVMGVGVLAIIIVFQEEIRKFFLYVGSNYFRNFTFSIESLFENIIKKPEGVQIEPIVEACSEMSKTKTGALIAIGSRQEFEQLNNKGTRLDALTSVEIITTIFFKNTPTHDGGMCVADNKIIYVGSVFPLSKNSRLPKRLGLRHRSALGMSESSSALLIVVSEEQGSISYAFEGKLNEDVSLEQLRNVLHEHFDDKEKIDLVQKIKNISYNKNFGGNNSN